MSFNDNHPFKKVCFQLECAGMTASKLAKVTALQGCTGKSEAIFKWFADITLNPFRTYGIIPDEEVLELPVKNPFKSLKSVCTAFDALITQLETRALTGKNAADAVDKFFTRVPTPRYRRWFLRAIHKSFDSGFSISTVNKAFGKGTIPTFSAQLCSTFNPEKAKALDGGWIVEPKYDGMRVLCVIPKKGKPVAYSRNGKEVAHFDTILKLLSKQFKGYVVDGEAFAGSWEASVSIIRALKADRSKAKLKFYAFDCIPVEDFMAGECAIPLIKRRFALESRVAHTNDKRIVLTPFVVVSGVDAVMEHTTTFIRKGYEGSVVKDLNAPYKCKRTKAWQKVKEIIGVDGKMGGSWEEGDFRILSFQEGTGKFDGMLGALIVRVGKKKSKVGTGFDDKQRKRLWKKRKKLKGVYVEVKYQGKTPDGKLRFPVFNRLREDK